MPKYTVSPFGSLNSTVGILLFCDFLECVMGIENKKPFKVVYCSGKENYKYPMASHFNTEVTFGLNRPRNDKVFRIKDF